MEWLYKVAENGNVYYDIYNLYDHNNTVFICFLFYCVNLYSMFLYSLFFYICYPILYVSLYVCIVQHGVFRHIEY